MTGYERISAVLNQKKADRTPIMLHSFMPAASEYGLTMEAYRNSAENIANCHLTFAEKYKIDGILMDIDTCIEADAVGVKIDFPINEPARAIGNLSTDKKILLAALKPEKLLQNERVHIALDTIRIMKKRAGNDLFIRGNCDQMAFSIAMLCYGMTDFMMDLIDEDLEDDILEIIDAAYSVHLEYNKLMHQAGADMTSFGDSSCGPDLISRDCYLKFGYPFHKRLQKDLSSLGIKNLCHICGNLDNILEDVVNIGFDAVEMDYKTDIRLAQKLIKGKSAFFGPIDPSGVFFFGTPEIVETETKRVLDIFKGENIVIGAGCALATNTPEENIRAFVNTVISYNP